jgi:hypothetical protein
MTNKELELIGQLTEVAMTVAELKAENKILKDINEKLMQALRIHDVVGQSEQCVLHSTDWQGKCFKCGEQIFVRESK